MKDTQVILEIIKELRADASLNYKKEVLARYSDYEPFKEFLIRVYNPRINYYMKKIPVMNCYEIKEQDMSGLRDVLNVLSGRIATGNDAINYVRNFLLEATQTVRELFELAIGRDIRAGVGVGIINEVYKGLIEEIPYCRCSKLDEKTLERFDTMPDGFLAQAKLDGQFSYIIKEDGIVYMLTRAGTVWTSESLKEDMVKCPNGVYIGEALIYREGRPLDRKTGNGVITSFIKREITLENLQEKLYLESSSKKSDKLQSELKMKKSEFEQTDKALHFVIWDSLTLQEFEEGLSTRPYTQRQGEAIRICFLTSRLKPVPSFRVYSIKEAQAIVDDFILEGGEGAIIKKLDAVWKDGTSKDLVKIKAVLDADLLCVDIEEGSGKYKGKVGALVLETSCGRLRVKVGTGLSDLDRAKPFDYYVGKVIEIQYNEFIKSKVKSTASLFLPRFIEMREDKNTITRFEEIIK
jgi:hypothetical protein